jgi:uncharacterized protein YdeI (YjbR/CyaY-like superfamily)
MSAEELAALPNLGPASARWLAGAGIDTVAKLRRIGAVEAFGRVALREGRAATANLLYALHAAIEGKHWTEVSQAEKTRLRWAAGLPGPAAQRFATQKPVIKRFASKAAWAAWLHEHHESSSGLWIEFARTGSGAVSLAHAEALEVALCYGWIDGVVTSVDARRFRQRFTPRRARSKWSRINCAAVERLHAQGALAHAGIREMEAAKRDGRWDAAYASPRSMTVPDDLRAVLEARPRARRAFEQLDSRNRYAILYRLQDARKPETRQRRLEKFVSMLEAGETLHPPSARRAPTR